MLATDILLSIAIVGIYTLVHVYLRTNYNDKKKILSLFTEGFIIATIITGILYYLIKHIAHKDQSSIYRIQFNGGVAQLVRARDS